MNPGRSWLLRALMTTAVAVASPAQAVGQLASAGDSAVVVLGPAYEEFGGLRQLRGRGWRAVWGTPLRLPLLTTAGLGSVRADSGTLAGVVTARRPDGRAVRILPVDLDPVRSNLPEWMWNTTAEQFLRDLVSTVLPTAPLAASALYRAVGLEAIEPRLGVLAPGDSLLPGLGSLAGKGVWTEPAPELDGLPFGRFSRVLTTDSLEALRRREPALRIDFAAYLASRLLDIVLGDPSRGPQSWRWGLDGGVWVPIAIRQEEAFLKADGARGMVLSNYRANLAEFSAARPNVALLTTSGYDLDRPFLARLDRATWDSVAGALVAALDTEAIEAAVTAVPDAHRSIAGQLLRTGLTARRDFLPATVDEYYLKMTRYPDIELSDGADSVVVTRSPSGDLDLRVTASGRETLRRNFRQAETEEVRLHLLGGADYVRLQGMDELGVGLRLMGGGGDDRLERVGPETRRVVAYDDREGLSQEPDDAARLVPRDAPRRLRWSGDALAAAPPDWGLRRTPAVELDITSDLGILVGGGLKWTWYGFDQPHYREQLKASVAYATRPGGFRVQSSFERRDVLRGVHVTAAAKASAIDVVRFFGYGNETAYSGDLDYYRVEQHELELRGMVGFSTNPEFELKVGPALSLATMDTAGTGSLITATEPYGSGDFQMAGLEALFNYTPWRARYQQGIGIRVVAGARFYPEMLSVTEGAFGGVDGEVRLAWTPRPASRFMVAGRAGGSVLRGTVPFTMAARIGGSRSLRGYETDRFAGDQGSAYGSLEVRARLFRFRFGFLPADFGVIGFGDTGRVWSSGESSTTLHWDAGGGIWVAPALGWIQGLDQLIGRIEVAHSPERTSVYFGTGFRF